MITINYLNTIYFMANLGKNKSKILEKPPITLIKISEKLNFLKKFINNILFILKPIIQKTLRITKNINNILISQTFLKLEKLFEIIENQIIYISALEKKIKELTT